MKLKCLPRYLRSNFNYYSVNKDLMDAYTEYSIYNGMTRSQPKNIGIEQDNSR
uniref:Uncharacterized protein n=1 Tax=Arion vulgaris TaxID=1028688 RepID=A0A0B7AM47_9EUPU